MTLSPVSSSSSSTLAQLSPPPSPQPDPNRGVILKENFHPDLDILSEQIEFAYVNREKFPAKSNQLFNRALKIIGTNHRMTFPQLSETAQLILTLQFRYPHYAADNGLAQKTAAPQSQSNQISPPSRPSLASRFSQPVSSAPLEPQFNLEELEIIANLSSSGFEKDLKNLAAGCCFEDGNPSAFDSLCENSRRLIASNLSHLDPILREKAVATIRQSAHQELMCWLNPKTDAKDILGSRIYKILVSTTTEPMDLEEVHKAVSKSGQDASQLKENLYRAEAIWKAKSVFGPSRDDKLEKVKELIALLCT